MRQKEHFSYARRGETGKSAFSDHLIEHGHFVDSNCLSLVKEVRRSDMLDIHECLAIEREKRRNPLNIINADSGPIDTVYKRLV